jgi:hypothetical protein
MEPQRFANSYILTTRNQPAATTKSQTLPLMVRSGGTRRPINTIRRSRLTGPLDRNLVPPRRSHSLP